MWTITLLLTRRRNMPINSDHETDARADSAVTHKRPKFTMTMKAKKANSSTSTPNASQTQFGMSKPSL